jgi:UDP-N-acetylglucosamine acyltransferase
MNQTAVTTALRHPTAVIHPRADVHPTAAIGAYAVVGEDVQIGAETVVGPHVVIEGWTEIGVGNKIFSGASIGAAPQDLKYGGEASRVVIGNYNVIREYVTINRATITENEDATILGNNNLLMAYVHIGHNCVLGDQVIITNTVSLAGHVHIESKARIGGMVGVHQFVHIGRLAMVGGMARVDRDIPPYTLVEGHPARIRGFNWIGLERSGISESEDTASFKLLKQAYRLLYRSGGRPLEHSLKELQKLESNPHVEHLYHFLSASVGDKTRRGPTPPVRKRSTGD